MGALTTALTVATVASQAYGAYSGYRAGQQNRRAANQMADDVLAQGEFDATRAQRELAQILGSQRAIIVASGVDVNQGTAALIREQTTDLGEADIAQIRLNAAREAWGIRATGNLNARAATNQAIAQGTTLLTNTINQWSRYSNRYAGPRSMNRLFARNQGAIDRALGGMP